MSSSSPSSSLQPVPAPRTPRGRQVAKEFVSAAAEKSEINPKQLNPCQQEDEAAADRRKPLVWTKDEFNLTELIDSVEKNILKLEEMENRPNRDIVDCSAMLQLGPPILPLTEEILNLPGYKPNGGNKAVTTRQKSGERTTPASKKAVFDRHLK